MPLKVKKNNVEQTINLKEVFGVDFSGKENLKQLIGQAIIDKIVERTKNRKGIIINEKGHGTEVALEAPYSQPYVDSLAFKAAGKSKGKVNMSLSGDMLGLLDIKKIQGNTITIGWNDSEQNPKAYNHMIGDTVPKRPFFGVSNEELKDLKSEFGADVKEAIRVKQDEGKAAFNNLVLGLLEELNGSEG